MLALMVYWNHNWEAQSHHSTSSLLCLNCEDTYYQQNWSAATESLLFLPSCCKHVDGDVWTRNSWELWLRCVDDTFILWHHNHSQLDLWPWQTRTLHLTHGGYSRNKAREKVIQDSSYILNPINFLMSKLVSFTSSIIKRAQQICNSRVASNMQGEYPQQGCLWTLYCLRSSQQVWSTAFYALTVTKSIHW